MQMRAFGKTGLKLSALGFGAMHLNDERTSEAEADRLLGSVLDLGINLIDTARGYGLSEERIGRHLAHRRQEFVLSTKVGYGIAGQTDWTYDCIVAGVEAALQRMRCEVLDIVHLHSCPLHVLQQGDVIRALETCRTAGKVRVCAYSGDNAELDFALQSGHFASVQTSLNVCDQLNLAQHLPAAQTLGIGVIAKRALGGAVWRFHERPQDHAEGQYWDRWQAMGLGVGRDVLQCQELALRFAAHADGVTSSIVGTRRLEHLQNNLAMVEKGPLPAEQVEALRQVFQRLGGDWPGLI